MGEAARRKAAEKAWLATLDDQERALVAAAKALAAALPLDGACYRAALFLKLFLDQERGLTGNAVVGFVNDGSDQLYASHAWFEFRGLRTDLTLCRPMRSEVQPRGPLVIHGKVIADGWPRYTYHTQRPPEGVVVVEQLMADPVTRPMVVGQEQLHRRMVATARDNALVRAYLDDAPDGLTYERIAATVGRA